MLIFPEIDKKQTKKRAHQVLNNYQRLLRVAGVKNTEVHLERSIIEEVDSRKYLATKEITKIETALQQLDSEDYQVLRDKYLTSFYTTNIAIYMDLHMSESKFYRVLDNALICFAEAYEDGELLVER